MRHCLIEESKNTNAVQTNRVYHEILEDLGRLVEEGQKLFDRQEEVVEHVDQQDGHPKSIHALNNYFDLIKKNLN